MNDDAPLPPPTDPTPSRLQADAIKQSWISGVAPDARAALERHPGLLADKSVVIDLAYEEYCLRREAGEAIDPDAFCERFPVFRTSLRKLLAVHSLLADNSHLVERTATIHWPEPGQQFGEYQILRELGRGSFARVFLATESTTGDRPVVVKFSVEGSAEARTLGRLEHPNIVPVLSARQDSSGLTIVCMPYLGEATLQDLLDRAYPVRNGLPPDSAEVIVETACSGPRPDRHSGVERPLDPELQGAGYVEAVLHLGVQIAQALAFIHGRGVCHRDLKPSNVLLDRVGRPMLLDFNLSVDDLRSQLRAGGTLPYMAPEQLRWMEGVKPMAATDGSSGTPMPPDKEAAFSDPRADLFALGVLLYELLTGKHPFGPVPIAHPGMDIALWLIDRQRAGCRPLRSLNPRIPRSAAVWIESCLACDPRRRPASAAELARGLQRQFTARARAWRWLSRHRRTVAAAGLFSALVVGAAGWALASRPPLALRAFAAGQAALRAGDLEAADRHLAAALDADPTRIEVWLARGQLQLAQGEPLRALDSFERARRLSPSNGRALAACAYALCLAGNYRESIVRGDQACAANFATAAVFNNRAFAYLQIGDLDRAETDLDEAVRLMPKLLAARCNRAVLASARYRRSNLAAPIGMGAFDDLKQVLMELDWTPELAILAAELHAAASRLPTDGMADSAMQYLREAIHLGQSPAWIRRSRLFTLRLASREDYQRLIAQEKPVEPVRSSANFARQRIADPIQLSVEGTSPIASR